MKKVITALVGAAICLVVVLAGGALISYASLEPEQGKICEGVYVNDVKLGGMTEDEAKAAIDAYVQANSGRNVAITVGGNVVTIPLSDLGYTCDEQDYVTQAMNVGKVGNIVKRFKDLKDAQNGQCKIPLSFTIKNKKAKKAITAQCGVYSREAKNAGVSRVNGQFVYTDAQSGEKIDVNQTIDLIKKAIVDNTTDQTIAVTAVVTEDIPTVTREQAELCKDKLGTFSTSYSTGAINRCKNLANAASLINGKVVYPGETFSVYQTISPIEVTNGYYLAPSYENGEVVESAGGGVCQVSTTLYNAIIRSELEIVDRSPHSMKVSYVEPSMDAAIAGTYKDFKFKNNTDAPIYLMGEASNGTIYFTVYGHETRSADREVSFQSEVTETMKPGADKVTYDKTKPESYEKVTQEAHEGCKAVLWKIVTENGQTTKTQFNTSTYYPSPRYVVKGSKKKEEKKEDATASTQPAATPGTTAAATPAVTQAPTTVTG